jgi:hypothetical protein
MPIDDPSTWAQGAAALKAAFDSIRTALSIAKDVRSLGVGSEQQQKAIDSALTAAASNTAIAEAELAKAFGTVQMRVSADPHEDGREPLAQYGKTRARW